LCFARGVGWAPHFFVNIALSHAAHASQIPRVSAPPSANRRWVPDFHSRDVILVVDIDGLLIATLRLVVCWLQLSDGLAV